MLAGKVVLVLIWVRMITLLDNILLLKYTYLHNRYMDLDDNPLAQYFAAAWTYLLVQLLFKFKSQNFNILVL
jgi:hypothetical protein